MTPTYIDGAAGCQKGVANAETGIKIESFRTSGDNPRMYTHDHRGTKDGFVEDYDSSVTLTVSGEISGSTGLMLAKFGVPPTIANEGDAKYADSGTTFWGIPDTGSFFLSGSPTITSNRGELKGVELEFVMNPDITD